jgi:hypothetical protein
VARLLDKLVWGDTGSSRLDPRIIGQRAIALARIAGNTRLRKMSQRKLAAKLGIHETRISNLLRETKALISL